MFDSHCHLTDIADSALVLEAAQAVGVTSMLSCGYNAASNQAVLQLRQRFPSLPIALGLHPWFVHEPLEPALELIQAQRPDVLGEIGLDCWGLTPVQPLPRQVAVLEAQLDLAQRLGLAVTVHSRKAVDVLLPIARAFPNVRGALHAYAGSYEQLRPFLDLGYYVGVGGSITWARAKRLQRCVSALPLDRLLLETDAPAIGMDGVEPNTSRPEHLPRVLLALAQLRKLEPEQLERITDDNAQRLFGSKVKARPQDLEPPRADSPGPSS